MNQSGNNNQAVIRNNIKKMSDAFNNHDAAEMASVFMKDAFMKFPGQKPLEGRKAIEMANDQMMNQGISKLELETVEIESFGDFAYEVGEYELLTGDGTSLDNGNYLTVWKRDGDDWKIYRDVISSARSPES